MGNPGPTPTLKYARPETWRDSAWKLTSRFRWISQYFFDSNGEDRQAPSVLITTPTPLSGIATTSSEVSIGGEVSDDAGVTWRQIYDYAWPNRTDRYSLNISSVPWLTFGDQKSLPEEVPKLGWMTESMEIDPFDGSYPPEDTGSDGLSVCKAIQALGKIRSYRHAFGIDQALHALVLSPVITGIPWYDGMFTPDKDGFVWPTGRIVGGHEICVNEIVPGLGDSGYVGFTQSWGTSWGLHGRGRMTFHTWDTLLRMDGDVTVPQP